MSLRKLAQRFRETLAWSGTTPSRVLRIDAKSIAIAAGASPTTLAIDDDGGAQIPSAAIGQRGIGADPVKNILQCCRFCRSCRSIVLHVGLTSLDGL